VGHVALTGKHRRIYPNLKNALCQQIAQGVRDVASVTGIGNGRSQAIEQTNTTVDGTQHYDTQIRG